MKPRNLSELAKGKVATMQGVVKEKVGALMGDEHMEAAGQIERIEGEARQTAAKSKDRLQGAAEEAVGTLKHGAGTVIGDERMATAGEHDAAQGKARRIAKP